MRVDVRTLRGVFAKFGIEDLREVDIRPSWASNVFLFSDLAHSEVAR